MWKSKQEKGALNSVFLKAFVTTRKSCEWWLTKHKSFPEAPHIKETNKINEKQILMLPCQFCINYSHITISISDFPILNLYFNVCWKWAPFSCGSFRFYSHNDLTIIFFTFIFPKWNSRQRSPFSIFTKIIKILSVSFPFWTIFCKKRINYHRWVLGDWFYFFLSAVTQFCT